MSSVSVCGGVSPFAPDDPSGAGSGTKAEDTANDPGVVSSGRELPIQIRIVFNRLLAPDAPARPVSRGYYRTDALDFAVLSPNPVEPPAHTMRSH